MAHQTPVAEKVPKLSPSVRVSGGTPAGMPDYKPMSPADVVAAFRPPRPALFQVWVDAKGAGPIPVGPRCPEHTASALAMAIRTQIVRGRERTWGNPVVLPVSSLV